MGLDEAAWWKALEFLLHYLKLCKSLGNVSRKFSSWRDYLESATAGMPKDMRQEGNANQSNC